MKGWLANAFGYTCAGIVILGVVVWIATTVGQDNLMWIIGGIGLIALLLWPIAAIYVSLQDAKQAEAIKASQERLREAQARVADAQTAQRGRKP